jgi:NitT/TauT family transport system substrate-binding protein
MFRKTVFMLLVLACVLLVVPAGAQDGETMDTTFFMTFVPNVQFSPMYVALEKGYFAEAGFNVTLEYGDEPVGVDLIAAGERQFGLISGEQVLAARAQGRPVVFFYEWWQKYPVGVVATVESGIESIADLAGRNVGIPGRFGASYSGLTTLLAANGMSESDINLQEIGFNAPEVVCVGGVEASVVYINNEPLQIRNRAAQGDCGSVTDVRVFPVSEAADMVSNGVITSEAMIAENPDAVRAMAAAFDAGLRDAIHNPAEAYLVSANYIENLPLSDALRAALETAAAEQTVFLAEAPDRAALAERRAALASSLREQFAPDELLQFEVLLTTIEMWDAEQLGYTDPASWEVTQDTLLLMGFLDAPVDDLAAAYTNDFLPGAGE